jgi:hypothetical protein
VSRGADTEVRQQFAAVARVLGGNAVDLLEHAQGAQCDVLEVAERRSDHIERPGHAATS